MSGPTGEAAPFADRLRALRLTRSLTQEELAERAGLSAKAVGALERGERRRPYPHTVRALATALELDPAERDLLVAAVPRGSGAVTDAAASPDGGSPPVHSPGVPDNVPHHVGVPRLLVPATPLIGRDEEIAHVVGLVTSPDQRLVTLIGPGGVGKTRLAVAVAEQVARAAKGRPVVVDLAAVRESAMVLVRIAAALGLANRGDGDTLSALVPALAGRGVLLVLDNLEQVLGCAPDLAALVGACADTTVLATSRAPLQVRAEHVVRVDPLGVPDPGTTDPSIVANAPAVQLLTERLVAAGMDPVTSVDELAAVGEVARRLDGLPLALELAAASTRLLPPSALLARLDTDEHRGTLRDLPPRQQSMRRILDWSHELLSSEARTMHGRLAVFSGGFDLASAVAVADPGVDVSTVLDELVDHALVVRVIGPGTRLRLLEPIRRDAMRRLHRSGEALMVADRHAEHFLARARAGGPRLRGPTSADELDRLERDHANLRSAFQRLVETDRAGEAAELLHGMWPYLAVRGQAGEGIAWCRPLRRRLLDDVALAIGHLAEAGLHYAAGDLARTRDLALMALPRARSHARDDLVAEATILAGAAAVFLGDVAAGRDLAAELRTSAAVRHDTWTSTHLLVVEAQAALATGDPAADRLTSEVLTAARSLGEVFTLATALNLRATLTDTTGDLTTSVQLLRESLQLSLAANMTWTLAYALPALAAVAVRANQPRLSANLFGAAASVTAEATVEAAFPAAVTISERARATARQRLGEDAYRAAWDAGRDATPGDLLDLADRLTRPGPA